MELTSKQRAQLRGMAATMDTILHVGKDGISENLIRTISDALEARELIKLHMLKNCFEDCNAVAQTLAERTRSQVVQVIGKKIVLYRESKTKKKIELPK